MSLFTIIKGFKIIWHKLCNQDARKNECLTFKTLKYVSKHKTIIRQGSC